MTKLWIVSILITIAASQTASQLIINGPQGPVAAEKNVLFKCFVTGISGGIDARLKWFKVGEPDEIQRESGRVYIEREDNQNLKLYIKNIQQEDAGMYRCEGQLEGNAVSDTITLELYKDITFDNAPSPQNPVINTDSVIICQVSGQPAPEISWRYRGEKIQNDDKYTIDPSVGLRIVNIGEEDNGRYECNAEVAATGRFDTRNIDVVVHTPPAITQEMGTVEGIEGQEVSISCKASGNPPPEYQFYKDDNEFPVQDVEDRVYVDIHAGVIDYRPLLRDDQGNYRCEASNQAGEANSLGELDVIIPPKIYDYLNTTENEGNTGTLTCYSEGEPSPTMSWMKVGNGYDYVTGENEDGRIIVRQVKSGELKLEITDLEPHDTSNYTCKSTNDGGFAEQNMTITVNFKPRFPEQETEFYGWAGKTRNVTCKTEAEPAPVIEWWQYNERLENNETFRIVELIKDSTLQIYAREEDSTWIYSAYTCRAKNGMGTSDHEAFFVRAMQPDPPQDVKVVEDTPTTLELEVVPPEEDGGMPVIGYRVSFDTTVSDYGLNERIIIENLRPSTGYIFLVSARNEVGPSDTFGFEHTMPAIQEPYPIVILSPNYGLYPFEYTLQWEKPKTGGIPIEEYQFKYRKVKVRDDSFNVDEALEEWNVRFKDDNENAPMLSYKLEGLTPDQHYEAQILARNDIGWSLPNTEFVFLTAQEIGGESPVIDNSGTTLTSPRALFAAPLLSAIVTHYFRFW